LRICDARPQQGSQGGRPKARQVNFNPHAGFPSRDGNIASPAKPRKSGPRKSCARRPFTPGRGTGNIVPKLHRIGLDPMRATPAAFLFLLISIPGLAQATPSYAVLYDFTGLADGGYPQSQLIEDAQGNLYGTTAAGGANQFTMTGSQSRVGPPYGVVFRLTPDGTETVLHDFGKRHDGTDPQAAVLAGPRGTLFGTTAGGGPSYNGMVYCLTAAGREIVLHDFLGGADGAMPEGSLLRIAPDTYAGTTYAGGSAGGGTVFVVDTRHRQYNSVFSFTGLPTGANPTGDLIADNEGNLYGTASGGGAAGNGAVFELNSGYAETTLYSFQGGNDGSEPYGGLVADKAGNLYGTTYGGGVGGYGTVFRIAPGGIESVLHSFAGDTHDGGSPYAGLVRDAAGNLYGTTTSGGRKYQGTVFKLSPGGKMTLLHSFAGPDGATPLAPLMLDKQGTIYGTTSLGGTSGAGVLFKIVP